MKIYTEEELKFAMLSAYLTGVTRPPSYEEAEEVLFNSLTPIELPSDVEIEKEVKLIEPYATNDYCDGFSDGINWYKNLIGRNIKEQILNQNK